LLELAKNLFALSLGDFGRPKQRPIQDWQSD
jgi:hypothetical protein